MLEVRHISLTLGGRQLLHNVSMDVPGDQLVAFLGPNGAGKTTLLRTLIGFNQLTKPTSSDVLPPSIIFYGQDSTWATPTQRVAHGLLYVPQHSALFVDMTVQENLWLVRTYHDAWRTQSDRLFWQRADALLTRVGLIGLKDHKAGVLSGGQKRKLEVVRALLMQPRMLLLDEPFAGVDPKSIYELKALFVELVEQGIGVLVSDHHVDQLFSVAQLVFVMLDGAIVTSGSPQEVLAHEHTRQRYLGESGASFYQEIVKKRL